MAVQPLQADEEEVWRALMRLMAVLPRTLDEDLQEQAGISLTLYLVLMSLSEAPDQQLRMSDLARRAALSPSRMSRIVQSLQARGMVDRSVSADDAIPGRKQQPGGRRTGPGFSAESPTRRGARHHPPVAPPGSTTRGGVPRAGAGSRDPRGPGRQRS